MTSALAFLGQEHDSLTALFERVSSPDEDRRAVLKTLIQQLASHVALEKQMLVPLLAERVPDCGQPCEDLTDMHDHVERLLTLIERRKFNSPDVPAMVTELLDLTEAHVVQANQVIFPLLQRHLRPDELEEVGRRMASDERQMLTHAHPIVPDAGPVAAVMRKGAQIVDRVRDRTDDIGRTSS
jgi:iron-sulfur cluster repair protein YtfE (RIC family)